MIAIGPSFPNPALAKLITESIDAKTTIRESCSIPSNSILLNKTHIVFYLHGDLLSSLLAARTLESHLDSLYLQYPQYFRVALIQGVQAAIKNQFRLINKSMRDAINGVNSSMVKPKFTPDSVQDDFFNLHVSNKITILESDKNEESCLVILNLLKILQTPAKQTVAPAVKVKSGKDKFDIFKKMLMEIKACTESAADAITQKYPTISSLIKAYQATENGEALLSNLEVQRNGNFKRVGPALSKRIYNVFMNNDASKLVSDI